MMACARSFAVMAGAAAAGLARAPLLAEPLPLPEVPCCPSEALFGTSAQHVATHCVCKLMSQPYKPDSRQQRLGKLA